MNNYDRVKLQPVTKTSKIGTVRRKSAYSFVHVHWDDGTTTQYAPHVAAFKLVIVTGDDALPRSVAV